MAATADRNLGVRISCSAGIALASSLALLRLGHALLPRWFRGSSDYTRGVHDPALWATLHSYLLIAGLIPAVVALACGLAGLRRRGDDAWAWVGVVSNASFIIVATQLVWVLAREGFWGFVLDALPGFVDV